ncbi:MAG: YihY family inner membrane protein [Polaromonas sp.]|uniref:YihY family inner membrane protein n=1 Tax=Polaromonas sp. TaxID=1869339 RepID=UPI00273093AC|nr:YhjD/YihY/BrkB family envelope integrity protein [Polaromonas sp.]MDP2255119.1 YihY family inner membrane protein [Polaromonas sp.]MDP3708188.1 YihY family inner membrane protein [Polaromonas sp.]
MKIPQSLQALLNDLAHFPWRHTAATLRDRFREDHMGLTASSLTFTTSIALVPFFTVALAVFTAFPMFSKLQGALQDWLIQSLIPDNIARQVLGYLTQFTQQANKLGVAGLAVLLGTAIALILTIDRTLNGIWRVKKPRPLAQRVLIYWAAITLGPLLLAASLAVTSYVLSASRGLVGPLPVSLRFLLDVVQFFLVAGGMAALYRYVPNTYVKWTHAWAGGLFVAASIELSKKVLALYLDAVPTYSLVYGAFATVPILLVWIYVSWVVVLMGAVIAAYLPSLLAGVARRGGAHGWLFQLAVEVLQQLDQARATMRKGVSASQLAGRLQVDVLQLEPVLETLVALDWVGQLHDEDVDVESRYLLLVDPDTTLLEPLMQQLLLDKADSVKKLWEKACWPNIRLRDAL